MSKNTPKYHFNTCISPYNKLGKFMSFTKDDKVLRDFIDYLTFYTTRNHAPLLRLLNSDNAPALYLGRLAIDCIENKIGLFRAWVSTAYLGTSIKICELREIKVKEKIVLKISIYGKGLKLLRDDIDLRKSLKIFFTDRLCLDEDLTVCRIDYTCDCMKYNFKKVNSLRCKKGAEFKENDCIQTKYFGVKGHDTAYFIRYYDKKAEVVYRGTADLYPEYQFLPCVMRYELQVNSKGLDPAERYIKLSNLYDLINLGYDIPFRDRTREKEIKKDESLYQEIVNRLNQLKNTKNYDDLDKVFIYLDSLYRKRNRVFPLYSPSK